MKDDAKVYRDGKDWYAHVFYSIERTIKPSGEFSSVYFEGLDQEYNFEKNFFGIFGDKSLWETGKSKDGTKTLEIISKEEAEADLEYWKKNMIPEVGYDRVKNVKYR